MFDYSKINKESLKSDLNQTIENSKNFVSQLKKTEDINLESFDLFERQISDLSGRVTFMGDVHLDEEIRNFANEAESIIENYILETITDVDLYKKFQEIDQDSLEGESLKYFKDVERDFINAGHSLESEQKVRLIEIEKRLIDLEIAFSKNIADDKTEVIFKDSELEGLSLGELNNLKKKDNDFVVTMAYPDVNAVMENCKIRESRKLVWKAFNNRAVNENSPILKEAVTLRNEKAKLFGFETWAEYRLQDRMAKTPSNVDEMYKNLIPKLQESAAKEKEELVIDGVKVENIEPWDVRYFITNKRNKESNVDSSEIKKYFYIHDVKKEMFSICEEVFDIVIQEEDSGTAWHEDVELWSISESTGEKLAYFYLDLYPRLGKFTHAAVFDLSIGSQDGDILPVSSMVANFPNPNSGDGLMTFDEVETLFHEFGHVLHFGIGKAKYARFVGANVEWDFVEAPSQIMEHWVWRSECLKRFSKHIDTGESLDEITCNKLNESKNIGVSLLTLRQVSFGLADQHLHGKDFSDSLTEIEKKSQSVTTINYPDDTNHLGAFGHLLGGYDAAYYGYLWAEIIGDDLFSRFEEEGVLSNKVGVNYKEKILRPGGTKPAQDLVEEFLGRPWNDESYLLQRNLN